MAIVTTSRGEIDESLLNTTLIPQTSEENVWVVARECRLKAEGPQGEVIRRDVWATLKSGLATQVASGL